MLTGRYDPSLVLLSILVAVFASYTALSVVGRVKQSHGYASYAWTAGGAVAMGSGIWAMHFIGMLAFSLPIPLGYDVPFTLLSLVLPIAVSATALWQLRDQGFSLRQLASSAILFGLGINSMHYTGMAALRMQPSIVYDPLLFALSVVIAIATSAGALWIGFRQGRSMARPRLAKLAGAVVMGFAIVGMHYTGMAAANFPLGSVCMAATGWIDSKNLAILVTAVVMGVLLIAVLTTIYDARLATHHASLAASIATAEQRKSLYLREVAARVEAERLSRSKDEFLSTVSHELRTPLNAILGWSQLLLQKRSDDAAMLRKGLETIARNARAQAQLIDDLLDMSRILSGKLRLQVKPVWPAEFIGAALESVRPAAMAKSIALKIELDQGVGPVLGDVSRMQQVMWNLLSNAIKFTEPGGAVSVALRRDDEQVRISVSDTGIGISPAFLPHVFDRFRQADTSTTRQHGGLGLGLSIARQLVELNGGVLSVDSPGEGKGATFTILMPVQPPLPDWSVAVDAAPESLSGAPEPSWRPVGLNGATILVLDDEPDSLEVVRVILSDMGANIVTAKTPQEALQLLETSRPDLLISDLAMPGLDGFELIRRVRANGDPAIGAVPAIALSAFARKEDLAHALASGFNAYLVKPVSPARLTEAVAELTGLTDEAKSR